MYQISHEYRTARKNHVCQLCNEDIEKGKRYCHQFNKEGSEVWGFDTHLECNFLCQELYDFINPWDGMHDDEFLEGLHNFCRRMICPNCPTYDDKCLECKNDESFCMDKIVAKLKDYDFCLVRPPEFVYSGKRCWGFVKKEEPVTKLPGEYEK